MSEEQQVAGGSKILAIFEIFALLIKLLIAVTSALVSISILGAILDWWDWSEAFNFIVTMYASIYKFFSRGDPA